MRGYRKFCQSESNVDRVFVVVVVVVVFVFLVDEGR